MAIRRLFECARGAALVGAVQLALVAGGSAVTAHASADPLAAWCDLHLGQGKAEVLAAMGSPQGDAADSVADLMTEMAPGSTSAEWDTSGAILLAGFDKHGNTTNLLAYDAQSGVGPVGPPNLGCEPFRNQNS
jgi:hypothetical protein